MQTLRGRRRVRKRVLSRSADWRDSFCLAERRLSQGALGRAHRQRDRRDRCDRLYGQLRQGCEIIGLGLSGTWRLKGQDVLDGYSHKSQGPRPR